MKKKIVIASDHAGFNLKEKIKEFLTKENYQIIDIGCYSCNSVDYPIYGVEAVKKVIEKEVDFGILICGTGIGMSIVANRFQGIRAALCNEPFSAKMARLHNDANVLVLGGRIIGEAMAIEIVQTFFSTPFEGGRHERRLNLIESLTKNESS